MHNRVGVGLHYVNPILWNKGNIQNSAKYIVQYSTEKDNEMLTLITHGFNMGSHAPNEICALPLAGFGHVWPISACSEWKAFELVLYVVKLSFAPPSCTTKPNNYFIFVCTGHTLIIVSHVRNSFSQHLANWVIYKNPRQNRIYPYIIL